MMRDHVRIMISSPPRHAVAQVVGYIEGKSATHMARTHTGRRRYSVGQLLPTSEK